MEHGIGYDDFFNGGVSESDDDLEIKRWF